MKGAEKGFLLLVSHLGDPSSKPLTVAQFRTLTRRMEISGRASQNRELETQDLTALGYSTQEAARIIQLLSRQEQLEHYVNRGKRNDCIPITRISRKYPQILREKFALDCPGYLWAKGDTCLLEQPAIALVGSRQLPPENETFAREVGRQAALQGYVLISGNANGADTIAQESCLGGGGQVIAIVADGLVRQPLRDGLLYLSEDGFDMSFSAMRALSRNRLIHAMGQMTFVAGCTKGKGGTWSGAVHNLHRGLSPLYCFQDDSEGVEALFQMGANAANLTDLQDFSQLQIKEPSLFD